MKWRAPSDRTQMILLSPVIIPATIILVPMVVTLVAWQKLYGLIAPSQDWHSWFAWRPVKHFNDEDWMWLERVERSWRGFDCGCIYRAIAGEGE